MNKVIIKSIEIKNFKGIASFKTNFNEDVTKFYGANGSGKSTIKNAWEWALCQSVEDYLPNLNNKEVDNLVTSVEVVLTVNDLEYKLKRESKPKYSPERIKVGNENCYSIDGVDINQKNYQSQISNIIGDVTFENLAMLTDKEYFNTDTTKWKWTNRRKILLAMTGAEREANEIVTKEKYKPIKDSIMKGFATSDIKSTFRKDKNNLKEKLKANQVLIASKEEELNEYLGIDFEKVSQDLAVAKTKYTKLINASKKENETEELKKLDDEILKCSQEISSLKTRDILRKRDLEDFKLKIYQEAIDTKSKYDANVRLIKNYEKDIDRWKHENVKDVCYVCGQKLPEDQIKKTEDSIKNQIDSITSELESCKKDAKELYEKYNNLQKQYAEQEDKIKNFVSNEKIAELESRVLELNSTIRGKRQSDLNNLSNLEQTELEVKISNLEREMAKKEYLEKGYKQIKLWKQESMEISDNIIAVEEKEIILEEFVKEQTEIIVNRVNSFFSDGVSWSLYTTNYNGGLEEDCVCLYNNKRYSSLSTGERNTANMEVIKALQEFYNVNIPIFSDNAEANTIPYETDRQVIELYAKAGAKLEGCIKVTDLY